MKRIYLSKLDNLNMKDYVKRSAKEDDYQTLVNEPCVGVDKDTGEIIFLYTDVGIDTEELVEGLKSVQYQKTERSAGLVTNSRVFGYRPRITFRSDFCSSASLSRDNPAVAEQLGKLALRMQELYQEYIPLTFEEHKLRAGEIKKEWLIKDTLFSSGIVNKNNQLRYHRDAGNFENVFSCMLVMKGGIDGGFLSVPEYGVGLELKNNTVLMFNGQKLMHGVTPIQRQNSLSYRFSVVFYTLKSMWNCLEIGDELARIKKTKTEREFKRAEMTPEIKNEYRKMYGKGDIKLKDYEGGV